MTFCGLLPGLLAPAVAWAGGDIAVTGYATLGYARSDTEFSYLRYIDDGGTVKADSLVGLQIEVPFSPQLGVTVQGVASAPRTRDSGYEASVRWAFLSYRPRNDWLFRVGRLRPPVLINTQNAEVGVTYDVARLPVEVYSLSPVYDLDGGALTKTWTLSSGAELDLDAYGGTTKINYRLPYQRYGDQQYFPERITFGGIVLSRHSETLLLRAGVHRAMLKPDGSRPFYETFAPIAIAAPPPYGGALYVPYDRISRIRVTVLTLGADWRPGDWRITGEYGWRRIPDAKFGPDSKGAYVTVARTMGKWTPYATYARLLSGSDPRSLYTTVNETPVPLLAQGPPQFLPSTYHQSLADQVVVYDQYSTMLGAAYSFSATSKLKLEWMRTHVGLASAFVDGDVHHQAFNVYSISYSVAF